MPNKGQDDMQPERGRVWTALLLYLAIGWAAAEIFLTIRDRFALPEALDSVVLAIFISGFVAFALLQATGRAGRKSPLLYAGRLLAIAFAGSGIAIGLSAWLGQSEQAAELPSVAILPCDYEGIEDHAFLGPAAAEEVHAKLAKVAGIQIPAWRSVLKSVQVGEDKRQIAEILRVRHLADCRITEDAEGMELSASIIDSDTGTPVWSGRKIYASTDLVHALAEISLAITDALSVRLTVEESDRLNRAPTSNPEAYEYYLLARQAQGGSHWVKPGVSSAMAIGGKEYEVAMAYYRKAVGLDPAFAEAWAGMATATRGYGSNVKGEDRFGAALKSYGERAYEYAERSLEEDPCNAEALLLVLGLERIVSPKETPPPADRVRQTDPAWRERYERGIERIRHIIECEPNNATAWRDLANRYSNFAIYPSMGTEYPAEEMRAALMKALDLDPTNCGVQDYYIRTFRDPYWAPRPEDLFTLDETLAAIRSALLVNPECIALHHILSRIALEQGRVDEAIAWQMRTHELHPDNPNVATCEIGIHLAELGLLSEAEPWLQRGREAGFYACVEEDVECLIPESRDTYFSQECKAQRLNTAEEMISSSWGTVSPTMMIFKYREAMEIAASAGRPDLVRKWLDDGLEMLGTDDPVAILGKNPKRLITARTEGLRLVPLFRDLGLHDAGERMLELCRRDPEDPDQIVFDMDKFLFVDAQHRSLAGRKAEAMELLTRAVREPQPMWVMLWPGRWELLTDPSLDPLRDDPVYGPQVEQLIEEQEAWLAPARERAAKALKTGDWASLRTLIDEPGVTLATVGRDSTDNPKSTD
jgi:tetratricopeptide (TPR) repeat protein